MDWTKITDNIEVKQLLKQRKEIENKIKAIDENALIMYELEVLSIPDVVQQSEPFYCVSSDALVYGKPCKEWCKDQACKNMLKQ